MTLVLISNRKGNSFNNVDRINDVSKTLGHFPAVSVTDDGVQENLEMLSSTPHMADVNKLGPTSLNGNAPVSLRPIITIRATQKNRISWPVSSNEFG